VKFPVNDDRCVGQTTEEAATQHRGALHFESYPRWSFTSACIEDDLSGNRCKENFDSGQQRGNLMQ
jgi:hypothetical protein